MKIDKTERASAKKKKEKWENIRQKKKNSERSEKVLISIINKRSKVCLYQEKRL